ncbi:dTMP kinase [bacterium]|nr:dTMP kinase [bacterium]
MSQKGKFIVIDGTDGSGKATQAKLLIKKLEKENYNVKKIDFPQYGNKSAGSVEKYLNGEYGTAEEVGPLIPSIFYAIDRYDASFKIKKWLKEGKTVISDRYMSANMAHQGCKINDKEKRQKFFNWLYKLEFDLFKIPKPDISIILHVDSEIAQKLVDKKGYRDYIKGKKRDIHEDDIKHLKKAEGVYAEIAKTSNHFKFIECTKNNQIMAKDEITEKIYKEIKIILK